MALKSISQENIMSLSPVKLARTRRCRYPITTVERAERTQRCEGTTAAARYMRGQGYSLEAALHVLCGAEVR